MLVPSLLTLGEITTRPCADTGGRAHDSPQRPGLTGGLPWVMAGPFGGIRYWVGQRAVCFQPL